MLEQVRIARPRERYHAYPFELSGGMCQRVVIALALACRPQLLIADEPTTGLDVTTQKAVMELLVELTRERGMSTILITHDLGLAAAYCDRVVVMEKGEVVENAASETIFRHPQPSLYPQADAGDATARRHVARSVARGRRRAAPAPAARAGSRRRSAAAAGGRQSGQGISAPGRRPARSRSCGAPSRCPRAKPSARWTASASRSAAARASAWSANPAAANPPPRPC